MNNPYKVGDRVKFIGNYIPNHKELDPTEDLVPGYEGTVVGLLMGKYPISVRFDAHAHNEDTTVAWNVELDEIELISASTPLRVTNYHPDYGLPEEFRLKVLMEADATSVAKAAAANNVDKSTIYYWRKANREFLESQSAS